MNILVTGAKGFVGKNLVYALKNIQAGKDKTHPNLTIENIFCYDIDSTESELENACKNADFVFNFAGINRPKNNDEFMKGNLGFAEYLTEMLKTYNNKCPIVLSSSIQASLCGRYENSEYGKSKKAAEDALIKYAKESGAKIFIYRFKNVFGKWCKPNYNSVVATFCNNIANGLPIEIHNKDDIIKLIYIDDLVSEMISALEGFATKSENKEFFYEVKPVHEITLGELADTIYLFNSQPDSLIIPEIPEGSFKKKLYSTFLSYLPKEKVAYPLKVNSDMRGSFTELIKSENCGQVSVNITKPGITKGQHWHNTKWEFFIVVSGHGIIRERKIGSDEIIEFEVWGDKPMAVHMLPGYTHSITNLSDKENLVTVMWANELFNPKKPDTYSEEV